MERNKQCNSSQDAEVRKGPWTMEEDMILINYIANHGEGVWNTLAKSAGNIPSTYQYLCKKQTKINHFFNSSNLGDDLYKLILTYKILARS